MSTVYVVTSGCYSDYGINAIFSTKELAQQFIEKAKAAKATDEDYDISGLYWVGEETNIEEWVMDGQNDATIVTYWSVGMLLDDGSVVEGPHEYREFGSKVDHDVTQFDVKVPAYKDRPIVRVYSSRSKDHALKLAADKRHEWLRMRGEVRP